MHEQSRHDAENPPAPLTVKELLEFNDEDATFAETEREFAKGKPNNRHFWRDRRRARFPNTGGKG